MKFHSLPYVLIGVWLWSASMPSVHAFDIAANCALLLRSQAAVRPSLQRSLEETSFLAAITAEPSDDTSRLVFADWLDERGEVDRAAFIRRQIEIARLPIGDVRRSELEQEDFVVQRDSEAFLSSSQKALRELGVRFWFRRGFIDDVTLSHAFLLKALPYLISEPLEKMRVTGTAFDIMDLEVREDGVELLQRLKNLDLCYCNLGPNGAQKIASSAALRNLTELDLGNTTLGDEGVRAIAESPHFGKVKTLNLSRNMIGVEGIRSLIGSKVMRLEKLNLYGNLLNDSAVEAMAASESLRGLVELNIGNTNIGDPGATLLAESPYIKKLRKLSLSWSSVGDFGVQALLENQPLTELDFHELNLQGQTHAEARTVTMRNRLAAEAK